MAIVLRYDLNLTETTRLLGSSITDTDSKTGLQDAITPPWSTWVGITIYILSIVVNVLGFYLFGWKWGIGLTFLFLIFLTIAKFIVPKSESDHFYNMIFKSMINRYANYVKDNDLIRANAMKELLERMGLEVPDGLDKNKREGWFNGE